MAARSPQVGYTAPGSLTDLTDADASSVGRLGFRLVCDLRTPMERERDPGRWPSPPPRLLCADDGVDLDRSGAEYIRAMYAAATGSGARDVVLKMYADMHRVYEEILRELFVAIADRRELPVLIHCSAGKDRTGFITSMLLLALGASRDVVRAEYMLTDKFWGADQIRDALRRRAGRVVPDSVVEAFRVRPENMRASVASIQADFGSVDEYLHHVGLDEARRSRLRDALVVAEHKARGLTTWPVGCGPG